MSKTERAQDIVRFMTLFETLRARVNDNPIGLEALAARDASVKKLCLEVECEVIRLSMGPRPPELFSAPVDPNFIDAWRNYEARYQSILADMSFADMLRRLGPELTPKRFASHWEERVRNEW